MSKPDTGNKDTASDSIVSDGVIFVKQLCLTRRVACATPTETQIRPKYHALTTGLTSDDRQVCRLRRDCRDSFGGVFSAIGDKLFSSQLPAAHCSAYR